MRSLLLVQILPSTVLTTLSTIQDSYGFRHSFYDIHLQYADNITYNMFQIFQEILNKNHSIYSDANFFESIYFLLTNGTYRSLLRRVFWKFTLPPTMSMLPILPNILHNNSLQKRGVDEVDALYKGIKFTTFTCSMGLFALAHRFLA